MISWRDNERAVRNVGPSSLSKEKRAPARITHRVHLVFTVGAIAFFYARGLDVHLQYKHKGKKSIGTKVKGQRNENDIENQQRNETQEYSKNLTDVNYSLFHFIITKPLINWRMQRALEFVLYHHPKGRLMIHTELAGHVNSTILMKFKDKGYDFNLKVYSFSDYIRTVAEKVDSLPKLPSESNAFVHHLHPGDNFIENVGRTLVNIQKSSSAYSHMTDILRYAVLFDQGGVYLDTDMYVLKPLPLIMNHHLGEETPGGAVNGAILLFEKHSIFMRRAFTRAVVQYNPKGRWGQIGPENLSWFQCRIPAGDRESTAMPQVTFYPYRWEDAWKCFQSADGAEDPTRESFSVHLNSKVTVGVKTEPASLCAELLSRYCIFCDETDPDLAVNAARRALG